MNSPPTPWKGVALVAVAGSCWGFHGVLIKYALSLGASFVQVFLVEVLFASVFFVCFSNRFFKKLRPRGVRQWARLLLIGFSTIGVGYFLFLSYSLGPVAIPATLMFLYLPVVYTFSILKKHQSISAVKIFAITLVIFGAVLTTQILTTFDQPGAIPAVWAALGASVSYALVFILTPSVGAYTTAEFRSFVVSGVGFLGCLVILWISPSFWYPLGENAPAFYTLAILLGGVGQILPVIALMNGLPMTGSSLGGVVASVELPIAIFSAALLLGESLSLVKTLGVVLVLSGIVLYNFAEELKIGRAPAGDLGT